MIPRLAFVLGTAPANMATGHPAICEPVTSDDCKTKNSWLTSCDAAAGTTAGGTTAGGTTAGGTTAGGTNGASTFVSVQITALLALSNLLVIMY